MDRAIELAVMYTSVQDAYPNLTRKSEVVKSALIKSADQWGLEEVKARVKCDKNFTGAIARVVR